MRTIATLSFILAAISATLATGELAYGLWVSPLLTYSLALIFALQGILTLRIMKASK